MTSLIDTIERMRADSLKREQYPRNNPIASDISECERETVLGITHWQEKPPFTPHSAARMERGSQIENMVILELQKLGFEVRVERKPFELRDREGRLVCRGKVDGFIKHDRQDVPVEIKSMNQHVWEKITNYQDFQRFHWTKKYPNQLQMYLYANDLETGMFLLDDCQGHWKMIPVKLDLGYVETILQRLESAVAHIEAKTVPDFHPDMSVCRKCWAFGNVCIPPGSHGEGLQVLDDVELEADLNRRGELEAAYREYQDLDKRVKERLKGRAQVVCGDWLIRGVERTRNEKAKAPRVSHYWATEIERIGVGK